MGEIPDSERFDGTVLCTPEAVIDELGPILDPTGRSSTIFPDDTRSNILGRWCIQETHKFFEFVGVLQSQLTGHLLNLAEEAVLYRVCIRVLRRAQANRTNKPGGIPTYISLMENYEKELSMLEHYIRLQFFPFSGDREDVALPGYEIPDLSLPYPPSFRVSITVIDDTTEESIAGARIYVNDEWVSTSWKDGKVQINLDTLSDTSEPYSIQVKAVDYLDSTVQEADEAVELVFRLEPD